MVKPGITGTLCLLAVFPEVGYEWVMQFYRRTYYGDYYRVDSTIETADTEAGTRKQYGHCGAAAACAAAEKRYCRAIGQGAKK